MDENKSMNEIEYRKLNKVKKLNTGMKLNAELKVNVGHHKWK